MHVADFHTIGITWLEREYSAPGDGETDGDQYYLFWPNQQTWDITFILFFGFCFSNRLCVFYTKQALNNLCSEINFQPLIMTNIMHLYFIYVHTFFKQL